MTGRSGKEPLHPDVLAWGFDRDPAGSDWLVRPAAPRDHFSDLFGELRIHVDEALRARLRVMPDDRLRNVRDGVHGGAILGMIDQAVFMCAPALGIDRIKGGMTIDLTAQFIGPARQGRPLDIVVEVLRETGRLLFVRGTAEQDGAIAAAYSMTARRSST